MKRLRVIGARTVTVVALLAGLELGLRTLGGLGQWTVNEQSERYGWRMLPHQDAWSRDLTVAEHINGLGYRDRDWDPPVLDPATGAWARDAGVFRVAVVGNSMTFGTSVPIEKTWPRVLEDALAQDFARRGVQRRALVMNFAVQGYVFEQMARVYEDQIRPFRPDLLIVPSHPHDITPMKPAADDPDYEFRTLILRSATYDFLQRHVINRWIPPPAAEHRAELTAVANADAAITERPFSKDNQRFWTRAIERTEEVRRQLQADGGRLVIVSLPRWRAVFDPGLISAATKWQPYARAHPGTLHIDALPDFRPPMEALRQEVEAKQLPAGTESDFSTVTWTDASGARHPGTELDHASESLFLLDDNGHFSERGHAVLAQAIFRELSAAGMLP